MTRVAFRAIDVWVSILLLVVTLAVYAPVRLHEFLNYDDDEYVTENAAVRSGLTVESATWAFTRTHSATWHPITGLSHMLDVELFGLNAGAHLLVNVLLHATAAVVLFIVLRDMTGARWPSAWVAGVFALHPLHVESVAWVSERKDVLSGLLWMLTLWCYVRYVRAPSRRSYLPLVAMYALGLMAKPMLVTLPFVLLLLDWWPLGRLRPAPARAQRAALRGLLIEKIPLLALATAVSAITFAVQSRAGAVASLAATPLGARIANALVSYVTYLRKTIWPTDLAVFYPLVDLPAQRVAVAAAVLIGISAVAAVEWRRRPYLLVGWAWFLGTLVPVIGLVRQGEQAMADRFTYLPHIGLFVAVAWTAVALLGTRRRAILALAGAATVAGCALLTTRQLAHWQSSVTLFRHALAVTDDNYIAHTNLGVALAKQGARDEAMRHYEEALRIEPRYAKAHLNVGVAFAERGDAETAIAHYAEALRLDPRLAMAEYNWGLVLAERGDLRGAVTHYERALAADPDYANAHNNLGWALATDGKLEEAIGHYREALRSAPDLAPAHNNLAIALEETGRSDEAFAHYAEAVRLAPQEAQARYNLAAALAGRGMTRDALTQYREAIRLKPDWPEATRALAWMLATDPDPALRDGVEAVALAERARSQTGDDPRVLDTLAAAYAAAGRPRDASAAAERALALARAAGDASLATEIEARLQSYTRP